MPITFSKIPKGRKTTAPVAHVTPALPIPFMETNTAIKVIIMPTIINIKPNAIFNKREIFFLLPKCCKTKYKVTTGIRIIKNGMSNICISVAKEVVLKSFIFFHQP
ncbi:MAG: hypothetical protein ACTHNG_12490 [Ginsengibacter sp.]